MTAKQVPRVMGTIDGQVVSLQICEIHGQPPTSVDAVRALPGHGLEGDSHGKRARGGRRQVLLVDVHALDALGLESGDLREQITVDLPALMTLPSGTRLQVGETVLETTGPCEPCWHIGRDLGKDDTEAFRLSLEGRRGILATVISIRGDGWIRRGDAVHVLDPTDRSADAVTPVSLDWSERPG